MKPEQWLKDRTFHHSDFSNIEELLRKKREQKLHSLHKGGL